MQTAIASGADRRKRLYPGTDFDRTTRPLLGALVDPAKPAASASVAALQRQDVGDDLAQLPHGQLHVGHGWMRNDDPAGQRLAFTPGRLAIDGKLSTSVLTAAAGSAFTLWQFEQTRSASSRPRSTSPGTDCAAADTAPNVRHTAAMLRHADALMRLLVPFLVPALLAGSRT